MLRIKEGSIVSDSSGHFWEVVDNGTGFLRCVDPANPRNRRLLNPNDVGLAMISFENAKQANSIGQLNEKISNNDINERPKEIKRVKIETVKVLNAFMDGDIQYQTHLYVDDKHVSMGEYGGEPEDNSIHRDYKWVEEMLEQLAMALGAKVERSNVEYEAGE